MSKVDLSLAGNYLSDSDNLNDLEKLLTAKDDFSKSCMSCAMSALYGRIGKELDIKESTFDELSNINKIYLVRGAFPKFEKKFRAYIFERFYKFTS